MFDSIHEECGVFGVYENNDTTVASTVYYGLYALQHRGQESAGIAVCKDGLINQIKGFGLVNEVFNKENIKSINFGNMAIGHVRYSTCGGNNTNNIQPIVIQHNKGNLALAHNGNLVNATKIRKEFESKGAIFHGTSDTESICYTIVKERIKTHSIEDAIANSMKIIKGAYSCIAMTATKLVAFRDPNGFRPLCLGKTKTGGYVVSSESCALDSVGATFIRDIEPGEIIIISKDGINSIKTISKCHKSLCIFEYIYFARPDSIIEGLSVHEARLNAGRILASEAPVKADVVIGVPDSGLDAALGYSLESKIPYGIGFIKNKYIGRSFIAPTQEERENAVRIKLNVIKETIKDKIVVLIDDSIVRGTTSKRIIKLLKDTGAKEVHLRITAPEFKYPCHFGTDVDSQENLIACKYDTVDEICKYIGADSLAYISISGIHKLANDLKCHYCDGCFTGKYPINIPNDINSISKYSLSLSENKNKSEN
ncbi:MAG: amidophosphoribosyltransferase [Acholeplasmatales bacterium]|nr:amidophosphoribosyltransferase [Acholeplasmatales bacterium]